MIARRLLAALAASLLWLVCCAEIEPLEPQQLCDEAGYSLANRTLACTDDRDLANKRYERLRDEYACKATAPTGANDPQVGCAQKLLAMDCDKVRTFGDDLDAWLRDSPECNTMFARKDGKSLDPPDPCLPLTSCNGACVDVNTDFHNCGGCGAQCPAATKTCVDRECQL